MTGWFILLVSSVIWGQTRGDPDFLDEILAGALFEPSSSQCDGAGSSTSFRTTFTSTMSISYWHPQNAQYEDDVFQVDMIHTDANPDRAWSLRIGKGGEVDSFITKAGEAVANQPSVNSAWNDLVYQMVAVNDNLNSPTNKNFIHQAGVYMQDTGLPPPFSSPNVALSCKGNECITVNWGQQAHVPTSTFLVVLAPVFECTTNQIWR
jgi:hypothetical protein